MIHEPTDKECHGKEQRLVSAISENCKQVHLQVGVKV